VSAIDQHDHLPVEQLADYAEGLITDPLAQAATDAHLIGCGQCQQVLRDLRGVTALLQDEQAGPMPAMVAARLDAALAAATRERRVSQGRGYHPASLRAASATGPSADGLPDTGVPPEAGVGASAGGPPSGARPRSLSDARRHRARTASALAAAATVAAFAIGAAIFSHNTSDSDDGAGSTALSQPERAEDNAGQLYAGSTPDTGSAYQSASGQSFTAYTLSATARALLAQREARASGQPAAPNLSGGLPPEPVTGGEASARRDMTTLLSPAGLSACVAQLVPDPAYVQVLAVDAGAYDGAPAALLILSDATDPAKARVWVVGAACGQGQSAELLRTEILRD